MRIGKSKGTNQIAPKNYNAADNAGVNANAAISHVISRANTQYIEALNTDGIPFLHWHKAMEGFVCTCQKGPISNESIIEDAIKEAQEGNATYTDTQPHSDPTRPGYFKVRGTGDGTYGYNRGKVTYADGSTSATDSPLNEATTTVTEFRDAIMDQFAQDGGLVITDDDDLFLSADDTLTCGICFATGKTDGYVLSNGKRIVLDASEGSEFTLNGFSLDKDTHPYTFTASASSLSNISWNVELPSHFLRVLNITARNNLKPMPNVKLEFVAQGENYAVPFDADFLNSRRGLPIVGRVIVTPTIDSPEQTITLTHIEIHLQMHEWQKLQMEPLQESNNSAAFIATHTTSFTLPPTLVNVAKEGIIYEHKYNRMWKINEVTDGKTADGRIFNWSVGCRELMPTEQLNALLVVNDPQFNLSYRKLEEGNKRSSESQDVFSYINSQDDLKDKVASTISGTHVILNSEYGYDTFTFSIDGEPYGDLTIPGAQLLIAQLRKLSNAKMVWLSPIWYINSADVSGQSITPKVTNTLLDDSENPWHVAGTDRVDAALINTTGYGGTVSDASLIRTITALKNAGYKVGLRPIVYLDDELALAHRKTLTFASQPSAGLVDIFAGKTTALSDFSTDDDGFIVSGGALRYSYLHFAYHYFYLGTLCDIDAFLIGSQLKGLTHQKTSDGTQNAGFQFAYKLSQALLDMATNGPATIAISYEADIDEAMAWKSGNEVEYPLDALWAESDFVALNYNVRLTDWRNSGSNVDNAIAEGSYSISYLQYCFEHGIDYDYTYTSGPNSLTQTKTTIANSSEPWLTKPKALRALFTNIHIRKDSSGMANGNTAFVVGKPISFTSIMCPSLMNATNDLDHKVVPNVAVSAALYGASTNADDKLCAAFYYAFWTYWNDPINNPINVDSRFIDFAYAGFGEVVGSYSSNKNDYVLNGKILK